MKPSTSQAQIVRAAIYRRVTPDLQDGPAWLNDQRTLCRERASDLGATVVDDYEDTAGDAQPRPGLDALRQQITQGEIDLVVVARPSCLYFSPSKLGDFIYDANGAGVRVESVRGPMPTLGSDRSPLDAAFFNQFGSAA